MKRIARVDAVTPYDGRLQLQLADQLVVVRMASNPEPLHSAVDVMAESSIVPTNPRRPQGPDLFEM